MGVMYSERIRWLVLSYICRRLHGLFVLGGGGGGGGKGPSSKMSQREMGEC